MPTTFAELGIPFRLFEAAVEDCAEYAGVRDCDLCRTGDRHVFSLGVGSAVVVPCPSCGAPVGLDADDRKGERCACGGAVAIPQGRQSGEEGLRVCHACLRLGRAAITKDTELGMVSWRQAAEGLTHGLPGLKALEFELVARDGGWFGARVEPDLLWELLRTPSYPTWQGSLWLFCCREPMAYAGAWGRRDFERRVPDPERWFRTVIPDAPRSLWEGTLGEEAGIYVFRCTRCGHYRGHWDMA